MFISELIIKWDTLEFQTSTSENWDAIYSLGETSNLLNTQYMRLRLEVDAYFLNIAEAIQFCIVVYRWLTFK